MSNSFDDFSTLPTELQLEAIREGERRLDAQLQVASAADARALAWGGLLVAAITASLGTSVALMSKQNPDYVLAALALSFSGSLLMACFRALKTVEPNLFCLPGNDPYHWRPSEWNCVGTSQRKIAVARSEQAEALSGDIRRNAGQARQKAEHMKASFRIARRTIGGIGAMLTFVLSVRMLPEIIEFSEKLYEFTYSYLRFS